MEIIGIIAIIQFVVLVAAVIYAEKDWAPWAGTTSLVGLFLCLIISISGPKQSKTIETTCPPHIDTIITIKNRVPDTTYVYTFIEKEVKE